ncbi:MAG TPA: branched-chain amino acid ABC transporter permease [Xanthobacteraceae bacterium]|nr:branched-chain amino acid ABC transporter permease [Xanthobacteraceae bacterium]
MLMNALLSGLTLGAMYSLVAMGMTLQYGVSRIMNLAYGEILILGSFATYVLFGSLGISPYLSLLVVAPAAFVLSWLIYSIMLTPLVARARNPIALEVDSILITFGLLFVIQGIMLVTFGANYTSYSYLDFPVNVLGSTTSANRLVALLAALVLGAGAYLLLLKTRTGAALRAVASEPVGAGLVAIDVKWAAALGFALGGAIAALGGVLASTFMTFTAQMGVAFTMKALIVVIMAGVGNVFGAFLAGFFLGLVESMVATFWDPGLTIAVIYAVFLLALIIRPTGIFGKAA